MPRDSLTITYKPFLVGQILEDQNRYLIYNGEVLNISKYDDFNKVLWQNENDLRSRNLIRIFEYGNNINLAYYWYSNLCEPKSNRKGIYLVVGMSCSKKDFMKNKESFAEAFQTFLRSVINQTRTKSPENADEALRYLWDLEEKGIGVDDILDNILVEYHRSNNHSIVERQLVEIVKGTHRFSTNDKSVIGTLNSSENQIRKR